VREVNLAGFVRLCGRCGVCRSRRGAPTDRFEKDRLVIRLTRARRGLRVLDDFALRLTNRSSWPGRIPRRAAARRRPGVSIRFAARTAPARPDRGRDRAVLRRLSWPGGRLLRVKGEVRRGLGVELSASRSTGCSPAGARSDRLHGRVFGSAVDGAFDRHRERGLRVSTGAAKTWTGAGFITDTELRHVAHGRCAGRVHQGDRTLRWRADMSGS